MYAHSVKMVFHLLFSLFSSLRSFFLFPLCFFLAPKKWRKRNKIPITVILRKPNLDEWPWLAKSDVEGPDEGRRGQRQTFVFAAGRERYDPFEDLRMKDGFDHRDWKSLLRSARANIPLKEPTKKSRVKKKKKKIQEKEAKVWSDKNIHFSSPLRKEKISWIEKPKLTPKKAPSLIAPVKKKNTLYRCHIT